MRCVQKPEEIAQSSKTDSFDVKTLAVENWYSSSGIPIDLYFIDDEDEIIEAACDSYLNDGKCDLSFNNFDYQYDGGDCCAATCTRRLCGKDALGTGFDVEISALGGTNKAYLRCEDPEMVSMIIRLDQMVLPNSDQEPSAMLKLDCNAVNVFTIVASKSMQNKTEAAMVENESNCTFYIDDSTNNGETGSDVYVGYSIFHGYKFNNVTGNNQYAIFEGESGSNTDKQYFQVCKFRVEVCCVFELKTKSQLYLLLLALSFSPVVS